MAVLFVRVETNETLDADSVVEINNGVVTLKTMDTLHMHLIS